MPPWKIIIIVVSVMLVVVGLWTWRREPVYHPQPVMVELAHEAVYAARHDYKVELDFTAASIEQVETILAQLHEQHRDGAMNEHQVRLESHMWGAYIGEVIRRERDGRWERDHPQLGPGTYPLHHDSIFSLPIEWCRRRIVEGGAHNVWQQYQAALPQR